MQMTCHIHRIGTSLRRRGRIHSTQLCGSGKGFLMPAQASDSAELCQTFSNDQSNASLQDSGMQAQGLIQVLPLCGARGGKSLHSHYEAFANL